MKRFSLVAMAMLSLSALTLNADSLGGEIGVGAWQHDPSGWIKYPNYVPDNQSKLDLDGDLNLDSDADIYAYAKFEHPIPIIPNVRVAYQRNHTAGDGRISRQFTFGDITYSANEPVHSETKFDTIDGTLYYEVIDMGIDLDIGLTARYIDGHAQVRAKDISGKVVNEDKDFTFVAPMLYANVRIPIPLVEGLSIDAEGNGIGYDGNALYDIQGSIRYIITMGLGVEAGYRYEKIKLDDVNDVDADVEFSGFYGGVVWDF